MKDQQTQSNNRGCAAHSTCLTAFTLIELLVVISVISMLMAILMPSLRKAKESGRSAACLANLHNLTIAWVAYATENNEMMCSSDTGWNKNKFPWWNEDTQMIYRGSSNNWVSDGPGLPMNNFCNTETALEMGVLWPYLEIYDVYSCPTERMDSLRSYAISHAMGSNHNRNGEWNYYNLGEVPMPSQKMVFVDHTPPFRDPFAQMHHVGDSASCVMIDTHTKSWGGIGVRPSKCRHNNGMNASFADGSVVHWRWKDPRTIKVMKIEIGVSEASIDNEDITRLLPAIRGVRDRTF